MAGDQIFIFGFSRGRLHRSRTLAIAGICESVAHAGNAAYSVRPATLQEQRSLQVRDCRRFSEHFQHTRHTIFPGIVVHVSSWGGFSTHSHEGRHLPYTAALPGISVMRHAVSIDERRAFFRHLDP